MNGQIGDHVVKIRQAEEESGRKSIRKTVNWSRAVSSGIVAGLLLAGFIDIFFLLGITPFTFELLLGSVFVSSIYAYQNWTIGFLLFLPFSAVFGIFYALAFEFRFHRSGYQAGLKFAFVHLLFMAVVFFPFFEGIYSFLGIERYQDLGLLGSSLGLMTPLLLVLGVLLFGASMGIFYGRLSSERARLPDSVYEPGEVGLRNDQGAITEEEDPEDEEGGLRQSWRR